MIRSKHIVWAVAFGLVLPIVASAQQTPQGSTTTTTTTTAPTAKHEKHMKAHAAPRVNVNTATKEELMALPGMTEDTAEKLMAARPFKSKNQLVSKKILTKDELSKISSMITTAKAKAPKK